MCPLQVQIGMRAVSIDEFFGKNLINNLADLLGIDKSLIRVVNIVSESGRRRRRSSDNVVNVQIEIADPPLAANGSSSSNYTGMEIGFRFCFALVEATLLCHDLMQDNYSKRACHSTRMLKVTNVRACEPEPEPEPRAYFASHCVFFCFFLFFFLI